MARTFYCLALLGLATAQIRPSVCKVQRGMRCMTDDWCKADESCGNLRIYSTAGICAMNSSSNPCLNYCSNDADCKSNGRPSDGNSEESLCVLLGPGLRMGECLPRKPVTSSTSPLPTFLDIHAQAQEETTCYQDWMCPKDKYCKKTAMYTPKDPFEYYAGICTNRSLGGNAPLKSQASRAGPPTSPISKWLTARSRHPDRVCPTGQVCNKRGSSTEENPCWASNSNYGKPLRSQTNHESVPVSVLRKSSDSHLRRDTKVACYQDWQCAKGQLCNRDRSYDDKQPFRYSAGLCKTAVKSQANRAAAPVFLPNWTNKLARRQAKVSCNQDWQCAKGQVCNRDRSYDDKHPFRYSSGICKAAVKSQANRLGTPTFLPSWLNPSTRRESSERCYQNWECPRGQMCARDRSYDDSSPFRYSPGSCKLSCRTHVQCPKDQVCDGVVDFSNEPGQSEGRLSFCRPQDTNSRRTSQATRIGLPGGPLIRKWLPTESLAMQNCRIPSHCSSDTECKTRQYCVEGQCLLVGESYQCCNDSDCPDSFPYCLNKASNGLGSCGRYTPITSQANRVGLQISLQNWLTANFALAPSLNRYCHRHADCPDGQGCDPNSHDCVKWTECKMDDDCGKGVCRNCRDLDGCPSKTRYGAVCVVEATSRASRISLPSSIIPKWITVRIPRAQIGKGPCRGNSECLTGEACHTGHRKGIELFPCQVDSDCNYDNICVQKDETGLGKCVIHDKIPPSFHSQSTTLLPIWFTVKSDAPKRQEAPVTQPTLAAVLFEAPNPVSAPGNATSGIFTLAGSSGVPAMHAVLMPDGKVLFLDKVEYYTQLKLANGQLAYSSVYDPATQSLAPLSISTNAFCCAGTFLADGRILTVGGSDGLDFDPTVKDGFDAIRYFSAGAGGWSEPGNKLSSNRWYASAQILEDGSIFVASGSKTGIDQTNPVFNNPTYEILSPTGISNGTSINMDILVRNQPFFLYPFLHLLKDGNLFVFVARSSQLFNAQQNHIVKELPEMPGLLRTYGVTGGSVLLPLVSSNDYDPEVMICGGGASQDPGSPTDPTCGRLQPMAAGPTWKMTTMPEGRCMVEGTLLPDGTVLWLNGAMKGAQGWGIASEPAFDALIYNPEDSTWTTAGRTSIPRLYHSVALLLLDGTVLIAGSNPNDMILLADQIDLANPTKAYPTEFRIEIYTPPYLVGDNANRRPTNVQMSAKTLKPEGGFFSVVFDVVKGAKEVKVILYHGGFVTHSMHMGMRMIVLDHEGWKEGQEAQHLNVKMPDTKFGHKVVPFGPYVLYIVVDGIPSIGQVVMVE